LLQNAETACASLHHTSTDVAANPDRAAGVSHRFKPLHALVQVPRGELQRRADILWSDPDFAVKRQQYDRVVHFFGRFKKDDERGG
jgi:hypothetical protein